MTERKDDMVGLDALFAAARVETPQPPEALMMRITAQAEDEQRAFGTPVAKVARPGLLRQFVQALGGWPALGGLATATCAGIWLGFSPPQSMELAAENYLGIENAVTLLDMDVDAVFDLNAEAL